MYRWHHDVETLHSKCMCTNRPWVPSTLPNPSKAARQIPVHPPIPAGIEGSVQVVAGRGGLPSVVLKHNNGSSAEVRVSGSPGSQCRFCFREMTPLPLAKALETFSSSVACLRGCHSCDCVSPLEASICGPCPNNILSGM